MKIIVLGAGVLGVTSAYYLASRGHQVEVVERQSEAARECSYANGGQLSYSHCEPWANPGTLPKVLKWMWQEDAPLVLRFNTDPHMIMWGLRFLANCRKSVADQSSLTMLRLGLYSREQMTQLVDETGITFDHLDKGILHVYSNELEFEKAKKQAEFQVQHGAHERVMNWSECMAMEPALAHTAKTIYGGIHSPIDESGDIFTFTQRLADICTHTLGVKFHYDTDIQHLNVDNGRVAHVATNKGNLHADAYVMCMGSYSYPILKQVGIRVPIYPMKGYSITFPANEFCPSASITDGALKVVYSRLGDRIRVAGTAEFAGYNTDIRDVRVNAIIRGVSKLFPKADLSNIEKWSCLRPSTPDGPPIIGATKYVNLFMNTGHGTLGWTQAAGSGKILADIISGNKPDIPLDGLETSRYKGFA